ncbi:E4 SUMO-protein ligase PIAL1 [Labeo rohita]|uniref:E4 SUMO-protein ligase PIAL1 n=1 Tax=Labeo rohita TaxID=84645 RepID=A0ABQ8LBJ5_LABRO|nr:E4 SUMO-protein ligase PIAL1 [Labeo rohita]
MDALLGNEFMNLTSVDEVQDRGTIRVIPITEASAPQCSDIISTSETALCRPSVDEPLSMSSVCDDTDTLSITESETSSSRQFWPTFFHVPQFSFDAELKLEQGNAAYKEKGTCLIPDHKLKSNILEGLIQEIVKWVIDG